MTKRILFVDDEENILNGLKRMLRSKNKEWDMSFVPGGQDALEISKEVCFDAVVTDLRMPGIDGLQVVKALRKQQPEIIRIILSGHSDEEMIMKLTGVAHQFLAKPCDGQILINVLNRTFELREFLNNKRLQSLVAGVKSLPSIPRVYQEIMSQLELPSSSLQDVGKIISQDPAMTAKILQLVNSAFFGLGGHISDTGEAATRLGLDVIKALVLSVGIFSQFDEKKVKDKAFSIDKLWRHSLKVAALAKRIALAEKVEKKVVDECFLAGLLHEIGVLILQYNYSDEYSECRSLSISQDIPLYQAEQEILGTTHAAVGAYLLGLWSLSDTVVEAVAFHHNPKFLQYTNLTVQASVYVADVVEQNGYIDSMKPTAEGDEVTLQEDSELEEKFNSWKSLGSEEDQA